MSNCNPCEGHPRWKVIYIIIPLHLDPRHAGHTVKTNLYRQPRSWALGYYHLEAGMHISNICSIDPETIASGCIIMMKTLIIQWKPFLRRFCCCHFLQLLHHSQCHYNKAFGVSRGLTFENLLHADNARDITSVSYLDIYTSVSGSGVGWVLVITGWGECWGWVLALKGWGVVCCSPWRGISVEGRVLLVAGWVATQLGGSASWCVARWPQSCI